MEAKLIKKVDSHNGNEIYYSLIIKEKCIGTTHNLFNKEMKENNGDVFLNKLSLKNCKEVELGYDLESMADFYGAKAKGSVDFKLGANKGFEDGFNKAMELYKDKVFTLEDMIRISEFIKIISQTEPHITAKELVSSYVQSLQQPTEIDVDIETEEVIIGQCDCECHSNTSIMHFMACCNPKIFTEPKLDSEGCLILTKKI